MSPYSDRTQHGGRRRAAGIVSLALAVALGLSACTSSLQLDSNDQTTSAGTNASGSPATDALAKLPVKGRAPKTGYSRDQFGAAWADVDHNGCDTRNDILNRDLTDKTYKAGTHDCVVATGTLQDPYTGSTINFVRGQNTSAAVQIDHVVALSDAWQKGAQQLTADQREQLANDPYNLLAVDGPSNQQKSDGDAATWLPANKSYRCAYVARQIGVKSKYALWVTQAEHDAMANVLASCPSQTVPEDDSATSSNTDDDAGQDSGQSGTQSSTTNNQQSSDNTDNADGDNTVTYKNCDAVRAAGKAPLHKGDPGYSAKLDRDGNGVACE
ncbi:GmrSD restriction endonuclease domain-containing protein [Bifidobacterium biavatii]|uniref:Excalibur domain containing protein n=1 Tax=Bifidobacterium biavatii DSM 23969 TaxID=1437608 RepID=A0A086ZQN5_9BIFI|nr:DUF1524 domain-containing protein [Bifidobacterium biavatii]KFI48835.1 excalibur domain containing protein [Bifidobacterium biavatii DSM 23969]